MNTPSKSLASKIRSVWKTFFRKTETPREIQERHDLYKIALATTFRQFRLQEQMQHQNHPQQADGDPSKNLEELYDKAVDSLEKTKGLRHHG